MGRYKYKSAINTYKLQYDTIPGDHRNAWDYWGTECADNAGRCNGNGDNIINFVIADERLTFWTHLALAKMIEGSYRHYPSGQFIAGSNVPKSPLDGAFEVLSFTVYGVIGNKIRIGSFRSAAYNNGGIMTASEAQSIDKKMDDGKAYSGDAITSFGYNISGGSLSGCITGSGYILSSTNNSCQMFFLFE